jgi:hypothetical protein
MFFKSRLSTKTDLRKFRFLLVVLPVKRWLAKALYRFIFPLPVAFKRFAAPRLLFNFNILLNLLGEIVLGLSPVPFRAENREKTSGS